MIAIKDIKMPVNCEGCFARVMAWCRLDEEERTVVPQRPYEQWEVEGRPEWCPLVDVPDIHIGNSSEIPNNSDCVSRRAAIDAIESAKTARTPDGEIYVAKLNAEMNIQILPSAQPERPKGHWIDTGSGQECSECGEVQYGYDNFRYYCAKCGSDNR